MTRSAATARRSPRSWHAFLPAFIALTAILTVDACAESTAPDPIASVSVTPTLPMLLVGPGGGQSVQLLAAATTERGRASANAAFEWTSVHPSIATVSTSGLVTALSTGTATIRATVGAVVGIAEVRVLGVPVVSVTIPQDSIALEVSALTGAETRLLQAELRDSTGALLTGRPMVWLSTAPGVASVTFGGLLTAVGAGETRVIASSLEGNADTVIVTVTEDNTLPGGADLEIVAAAWTQAVQDSAGGVPLIRDGRAAVLNVLMRATQSIAAPSTLVLRILDAGGALVRAETTQVNVPAGLSTTYANPTAQFLLPAQALQHGRRWEVVRDPAGLLPDADAANDRYPTAGPRDFDLWDVPVLKVRFVPIILTAHGNATGNVTPDNLSEYMRVVRAIMPHGQIDVTVGDALANGRSFGTAPNGGASAFWIGLIGDIDAARVASLEHADAHWVGVVLPPPGFTFTSFGGFGYIPGNGASFAPGTRTTALVNVGWFNRESQTRELVAHELGHNFGRFHAPCGNPAGPDVAFPNPGGVIGDFGHDVGSWALGLAQRAVALPPSTGDILGYCSPTWISRYTYMGVASFRGQVVAAGPADARAGAPRARTRVLLLRGTARAGSMTLEPPVDLEAAATSPDEGDHVVEGRAADGRLLFTRRFALTALDHAPETRAFAVTVPIASGTMEALESIVVRGPSGESRRARGPSAGERAVPQLRTDTGGTTLDCGAGSESIAVQDRATGRLLGSAPASTIRLPERPRTAMRVVCGDGVRSTVTLVTP